MNPAGTVIYTAFHYKIPDGISGCKKKNVRITERFFDNHYKALPRQLSLSLHLQFLLRFTAILLVLLFKIDTVF